MGEQWRTSAACKPDNRHLAGDGPAAWVDRWFPERGEPVDRTARFLCAKVCPVAVECEAEAMRMPGRWPGLYASTSREARQSRRRRLDPAATVSATGVVNRNTPGASHLNPATYNRGCRCRPCTLAKLYRDAKDRQLAVCPTPRLEPEPACDYHGRAGCRTCQLVAA